MSIPKRVRVLYTGHVQGVGFRWRVAMTAGDHSVYGTVRNLLDGRVEIDVEGDPDVVERFLAAVRERLAGHIASMETEDLGGPLGRTSFEIAR